MQKLVDGRLVEGRLFTELFFKSLSEPRICLLLKTGLVAACGSLGNS